GKDQPVVRGALRVVEVVAEVLVDEDGHEIGGGHGGGRMPRLRRRAAAHGIDAQLLSELAPALDVGHGGHSTVGVSRSVPAVTLRYGYEQAPSTLRARTVGLDRHVVAGDARDGRARAAHAR